MGHNDAPLKEKLLHLQVELEEGSITEEQYLEAEALILREIREVQRRKIEACREAILTSLKAASPAPLSRKALARPSPGTVTKATKKNAPMSILFLRILNSLSSRAYSLLPNHSLHLLVGEPTFNRGQKTGAGILPAPRLIVENAV